MIHKSPRPRRWERVFMESPSWTCCLAGLGTTLLEGAGLSFAWSGMEVVLAPPQALPAGDAAQLLLCAFFLQKGSY